MFFVCFFMHRIAFVLCIGYESNKSSCLSGDSKEFQNSMFESKIALTLLGSM